MSLSSPQGLPTTARVFALFLVGALALAGGCNKPTPSTQGAASTTAIGPAAADARTSALSWAGQEPVALVHTRDAVLARAVEGGRSRVLWTGTATEVVLDAALDLVWVQGNEALDVIDLRARKDNVVGIARGLPSGVPISVTRRMGGGAHASVPPGSCDIGRSLELDWQNHPRLQYLDGNTAGWVEPGSATLIGAPWLRAELAREPGITHAMLRGFPLGGPAPAAPFAARQPKCAWGGCGRPIPFDGSGVELVVTSFERDDCAHLGCHLYDPAKKKFATPPVATAWGAIDAVPSGPCGVYHFDRSGKRFLIRTSVCKVGGKCEDLGGDAVGWLSGDVSVGEDG